MNRARWRPTSCTARALLLGTLAAACSPPAQPGDASTDRGAVPDVVTPRPDAVAPPADARPDAPDAPPDPPLIDGRFSPSEWNAIRALSPVPTPPPSPTNRYADDPRAAAFGRLLFVDTGFSADGRVACATCHDTTRAFTDGRAVAQAAGTGTRNTPSVLFAPHFTFVLWDGAADSLWSQPLMALENPREHATTRLAVAHRIATAYRAQYEPLFGPLPPLDDTARFPREGMPGDPRWDAMAPEDQFAVNRVVVNAGKAIEAFERTLVPRPAPFDRYVAGDFDAMSPDARDGLQLALVFGCLHCHNTPLFSDGEFHNVRMPDDPAATAAGGDRGRFAAIARFFETPFHAAGPFSDAPDASHLRELYPHPSDVGAFRTPTLRGVARTAPYGHAGQLATLADVVRHYGQGGLPLSDPRAVGLADLEMRPFRATDADVAKLVAFLEALTPDGL